MSPLPPPELQLALNFLATFFSRHPPEQQLSFSSAWSPLYGLSLPIRPFQGPLYTAIGPFFPVPLPGRGVRGDLHRLGQYYRLLNVLLTNQLADKTLGLQLAT